VESRRWDVSVSERDTRNFLSAAIGRGNVLPGPLCLPLPSPEVRYREYRGWDVTHA